MLDALPHLGPRPVVEQGEKAGGGDRQGDQVHGLPPDGNGAGASAADLHVEFLSSVAPGAVVLLAGSPELEAEGQLRCDLAEGPH